MTLSLDEDHVCFVFLILSITLTSSEKGMSSSQFAYLKPSSSSRFVRLKIDQLFRLLINKEKSVIKSADPMENRRVIFHQNKRLKQKVGV